MAVVISRKYEVLGQLGQGGMGVVYKVRHTALDTILALKVLPRDLTENPEMVTRFYREARVMARLTHPNIVRVLDIDRDDTLDFHYFVMEYLQGKTLSQYLREKGPLPLPEVLDITSQVARALAYAHNHKPAVIHRDIKPANIMIENGTGRVVVMDFGIAKELGDNEMTRAGVMVGTLKYCSPEQIRHEQLDGSADVYSLGMVLYESYTGTQFFAGLDESAVIGKVLYDPQENEPQFTRPAPQPFVALVTKAIAKSREQRYRRIEELLQDLEVCRGSTSPDGGAPVFVPPPTREEPPSSAEKSEVAELDERIRQLEEERHRRLALSLSEQVKEAREKAAGEGASQWAATLFQRALALEENGGEQLRGGNSSGARETYQEALSLFAQAGQAAVEVSILRTTEEVRQEMSAAKTEAERYGARDKARTLYGRGLALQTQADELWEHKTYQQAAQIYGEARKVFADACDLAYQQTLKEEAETSRTQALTAKETAILAGAEGVAASVFREATESERRANTAMERAEFTQGRELYTLARQHYERAAQDATQAFGRSATSGTQATEGINQRTFTMQVEAGDLTRWENPAQQTPLEPTRWEKPPVSASSTSIGVPPDRGPIAPGVTTKAPAEGEEDRWEIGEKAKVPPRSDLPPPVPVSSSRTNPVLIGAAAVILLAVVAWFGRGLLTQAPTPLALTRVEPQTDVVQAAEGKAVAFSAEAQGAGSLRYEWSLEGRQVSQEKNWSYSPTASESGGEPKAVQVVITDEQGQKVERRWRVTVESANRPPQLVNATPAGETLELVSGSSQEFKVEASDPENEPLTYEWMVDGNSVGTQPTFVWQVTGEGPHQVRAVVRDRGSLAATREWRVAALKPAPLKPQTEPQAPEQPASPKNMPPQIVQQLPAEKSLTVQTGQSLDFSVTANDPENEELAYAWSLNGKRAGKDPGFTFAAVDPGQYRIDFEVTDRGGLKARQRWDVEVPAPPAEPRIVMFTPHKAEITLFPHQSRFFGVEVKVMGTIEPELNYQWKIDGKAVSGQEVIEFKDRPVGNHRVEVTVTTANGLSTSQRWTVVVRKEEGEDLSPPSYSPTVQVFDLDNSTSKDKKAIIITGKVRNVDDRSADNVLVTISAMGTNGQPVLSRVVLPSPQPLAGGETATFQIAIANRDTIADFRIEVVSK